MNASLIAVISTLAGLFGLIVGGNTIASGVFRDCAALGSFSYGERAISCSMKANR